MTFAKPSASTRSSSSWSLMGMESTSESLLSVCVSIVLCFLLFGSELLRRWSGKADQLRGIQHQPSYFNRSSFGIYHKRPSLSEIFNDIERNSTNGYLSHLFDFAIIGFTKTSTTNHMKWLAEHPEINGIPYEDEKLRKGDFKSFVSLLYQTKGRRSRKVGYKDPHLIESFQGLEYLAKYFPSCRLLVGVRHPVEWFERFYNFRIRMGGPDALPSPELLNASCTSGPRGCSIFHLADVHFLVFLLLLDPAGFCLVLGASQQSTIKTTIYNKINNIHNNQGGGEISLLAHSWYSCFCLSW
jgi:hypothetical protein